MQLGCPIETRLQNPAGGLAYEVLSDAMPKSVLAGHAHGVVTVNIAEADDAERERRRLQMGEPYRTLLGHFRHEVGHYYWERLVHHNSSRLEQFRTLFGDERADYASALHAFSRMVRPSTGHRASSVPMWTSHPWEDWAESWAHYLHMSDMLGPPPIAGCR